MRLDCIAAGPLQANTYFIGAKGSESIAVIDASDASVVLQYLRENKKTLSHAIFTHGHFDHIAGAAALREETGCELWIHEADGEALRSNRASLATLAGMRLMTTEPTRLLQDGDEICVSGVTLRVLHTPGHSEGSILLVSEEENLAFTGDTVFLESVGRTDLPGGSLRKLTASVKERVLALPPSMRLFSGHGEPTTVRHEQTHCPLLRDWRHPWFD